jgi:hypothetical protein
MITWGECAMLAKSAAWRRVGPVALSVCSAVLFLGAQSISAPDPVNQPSLGHLYLVLMENKDYHRVIGSPEAPFINSLASRYTLAEQYYTVANPSLPNYLALLSGSTLGVDNDCTDCFFDAPNLADEIEAHGRTWRSYQEDLPGPCFLGVSAGGYALRHNPFLYFRAIRDDPQRCQNVVPLDQLEIDQASGTLPDLVWVTPNLIHDMHDGSVADGDRWLAPFVSSVLESSAWQPNDAFVLVWDEGNTPVDAGCCGGGTGGHVPMIIVTQTGTSGTRITRRLTHYSLLASIEQAWGLPALGHSGDADIGSVEGLLGVTPIR